MYVVLYICTYASRCAALLCGTARCCRATLAMIPAGESEANRRKNKSGDYEVSPQARRTKDKITTFSLYVCMYVRMYIR